MNEREPIEIEDGAVPCSSCGSQPMMTGDEESKSYRCHCSNCHRKMAICHWSTEKAIEAWNDAQKDEQAEPTPPCPYCGAGDHGAVTQPTSTCTRNLWDIIGSLREERETLRAALESLVTRAGNVADYDLRGHTRTVWTDKQSLCLPGSVANCHSLREALAAARDALNPNAGTTQAFPKGRWTA